MFMQKSSQFDNLMVPFPSHCLEAKPAEWEGALAVYAYFNFSSLSYML
jgi:hypothetical protein